MAAIIALAFIVVPMVEIAVLVKVGGVIGLGPTLALVVATAIAGTALLRHQGLGVLRRLRDGIAAGELPVAEVFDGACLLLAGALLLTPGFVTDALGLALFVPWVRAALRAALARHLEVRRGRTRKPDAERTGPVIDGDWRVIDDDRHEDRP